MTSSNDGRMKQWPIILPLLLVVTTLNGCGAGQLFAGKTNTLAQTEIIGTLGL
jgi:hypothetical protein